MLKFLVADFVALLEFTIFVCVFLDCVVGEVDVAAGASFERVRG